MSLGGLLRPICLKRIKADDAYFCWKTNPHKGDILIKNRLVAHLDPFPGRDWTSWSNSNTYGNLICRCAQACREVKQCFVMEKMHLLTSYCATSLHRSTEKFPTMAFVNKLLQYIIQFNFMWQYDWHVWYTLNILNVMCKTPNITLELNILYVWHSPPVAYISNCTLFWKMYHVFFSCLPCFCVFTVDVLLCFFR